MPNPDLGIADIEDPVEIGRGGFGVVYRARQAKLDRTVAVKVIEQAVVDDDTKVRFARECMALGSLSGHPNVVTIHDSGFTPAGYPYLVMEFLPDGSLADYVGRRGALSTEEGTDLAIQVIGALETAHRAGVLHRDLKPENILLGPYGEPKLGDFGIARLESVATMTGTGTIWGSPAHAAPEVIEGKGASVRSDVYSMGSTLYVLLSAQLAFQRPTDESIIPVLHRVTTQPPPDLRLHGVPEPVVAVVEAALSKDPAGRPPTAKALGDALNQARSALGLGPVPMRIRGPEPASPTVLTPVTPATPAGPGVPSPAPQAPQGDVAAPTTVSTPGPRPPTGGTGVPPEGPAAAPAWGPAAPEPAGAVPYASPPATPGGGSATPGAWNGPGSPAPTAYAPVGPHPEPIYAPRPPSPRRSPTSLWVVVGCAAVLVLALVVGSVVIVSRTGGTATTTTASTAGDVATSPAGGGGGPASSGPPVDLRNALLRANAIPGDWRTTQNNAFTGLKSLEPCNRTPDLSEMTAEQAQVFAGTGPSGKRAQIFQTVAEFRTATDAEKFVDSLPDLISCGSWTDSDGIVNNVAPVDLPKVYGDQSYGLENTGVVNGADIEADYITYRVGRHVGVVGLASEAPVDERATNDLAADASASLASTVS